MPSLTSQPNQEGMQRAYKAPWDTKKANLQTWLCWEHEDQILSPTHSRRGKWGFAPPYTRISKHGEAGYTTRIQIQGRWVLTINLSSTVSILPRLVPAMDQSVSNSLPSHRFREHSQYPFPSMPWLPSASLNSIHYSSSTHWSRPTSYPTVSTMLLFMTILLIQYSTVFTAA